MKQSNYDQNPTIPIYGYKEEAYKTSAILPTLQEKMCHDKNIIVVDCYPGVPLEEVKALFLPLHFDYIYCSDDCAFEPEKIDALWEEQLTKDRVFGIMTHCELKQYFYANKIQHIIDSINTHSTGNILIYGVGASLITSGTIHIFAELSRWEMQLRYRKGLNNWRTCKKDLPILSKYKRGYFIEWRLADRHKQSIYKSMDYYLDMNKEGNPIMITSTAFHAALKSTSRRPFRLVPYFDPGVWGGHWMKDTFALPDNGSNYAWSFDGVPEENSLKFDFEGTLLEMPAMNLVFTQPIALLGNRVHARFGKEFPIRFDLLDTLGGQNLSLQVHPLTEYIQEKFHMNYTQDESYYIIETGENACVYLGLKDNICPEKMLANLYDAEQGKDVFHDDDYINCFPVKKHDHVLIPAGTVHGSGRNTVVLEISATPYIFTFKLWDWTRLGLDGLPRPVHLAHGEANIQWDRTTSWVEKELLHQEKTVYEERGILIERTGLHEREFIDTFRFTFTKEVQIQRNGSVHMLNLVEGNEVIVRSPLHLFEDYHIHFGETFILPEDAGNYTLVPLPSSTEPLRVIMACVR